MRIVPARDGGLARLRLTGGELSAHAAHAVARAAERCGTGTIEVTNRANLQLRSIRDDAHAELIAIALDAGLGPASASGDDLRNVMLSPLASDDTRALAARIVEAMQNDAALHALSPKFSIQLDANERLAMLEHPHDLWLSAIDNEAMHFAFGFASAISDGAIGVVARENAVRFVQCVLHAFLAMASDDEHRMRDLLARIDTQRFIDSLEVRTRPAFNLRCAPADASLRLGAHANPNDDATHYVGVQPKLGRLDAATLEALADLASTHAQGRLVMTPWQSVLIPGIAQKNTHRVLLASNALGFATDPRDPFARLIACAGSSGCAKSHANTKADGHRIAPLLPAHAEVHLSGCARSCAAAHPVDTTLFAVAPGRYDLYLDAHLAARDLTIEEAAARLAWSDADA